MPTPISDMMPFQERLLDLVPMALSLQDTHLNVRWVNRPALQRVGRTAAELVGHPCHQVIFGRDTPCPGCVVLQAMADGKTRQGQVVAPDGRIWEVTAEPLVDEAGEVTGAFEMAVDITHSLEHDQRHRTLIEDLQRQLAEIRTLKALLPICAVCHKIRDDEGYWNRLEGYIQKHTGTRFSHGLCPECLEEQYLDDGGPD